MAFTYNPDQLSEPLNHLRFLIQDTDPANVLLQDSEILATLGDEVNRFRVASELCGTLALKFAQSASISEESIKISMDTASREYRLRAKELEAKADKYDEKLKTDAAAASSGSISLMAEPKGSPKFTRDLHLQ